jgi:hypothetical protein
MSKRDEDHQSKELLPLDISMVPEGEDSVVATLEAIRKYCGPWIGHYQERGDIWKIRSRYLGLPAAALAAAAGVTGLADEGLRVLAGVLALVASALGAIVASLTPAQKSEERYTQSKQMAALHRNVSVLLYVDRARLSTGELREALEDVLSQLDAINRISPAPSFLYRMKSKERPER